MPSATYASTTYNYDDYEDVTSTTAEFFGGMCDKSFVREFRGYYEPPLYWIICLLGAVGNLLVVGIYAHFKNRLKTMTDVYLLNLAIADLLFLFTLPFWAADSTSGWIFGTGMCKIVSGIYKINFFSSMLLLTCISVDRYYAIVRATKTQNTKAKQLFYSKLVCVVVWLLAICLSVPEFYFAEEKNNLCKMVYPSTDSNNTKILVLAIQISMGFCFPLAVMLFCYTVIVQTLLQAKNFEKHKALKVILAVVTVFVLSQFPYNGILVVKAIDAANVTITDCDMSNRFDIAHQIMQSLAYMHSCLNPFLYAFIGVRFRNDLLKILKLFGCLRQNNNFHSGPKRSPVMSDTDTTAALSL
ncbi:C-C chemokine receptor type 9 [Amia ocellicauda]|uniref:C-C chemokine receptor type 9 n=1 Tax=Amia ocellicauda TaxID=2972642 RepID=UPI00346425D3